MDLELGDLYPRILDGEGCIYGRNIQQRIREMENRMERFENKLDKLLWALVGAAITFGTAAVMLGLNLTL